MTLALGVSSGLSVAHADHVKGWVDGVQGDAISGWVCAPGNYNPVPLLLSLGANIPSGGQFILETSRTDLRGPDFNEISKQCGSNNGAHRFAVPLREVFEEARRRGVDLRNGGQIFGSARIGDRTIGLGGSATLNGFPPPPPPPPPPLRGIQVLSATYGGNVGVRPGNATRAISESCNGRRACNYVVDVSRLGDPAPGRMKDFRVTYSCSDRTRQEAFAPAEANGRLVQLQCR